VVTLIPTVEELGWFPVDDSGAAGVAKRVATDLAVRLGFSQRRLGELSIVVSEVVSNLHKHADEGRIAVRCLRCPEIGGIEVVALDSGPGMADVLISERDGRSTAGTLGIGLGAINRLSDRVDGYSLPGKGTVLTAQLWPAGDVPGTSVADGISRPLTGERQCGDHFAVRVHEEATLLFVADGLGHGPLAAAASVAAAELFRAAARDEPGALLEQLHRGISHTRGAAVSIARIQGNQVVYAGIGNVAGTIAWPGGERRGMVSMPGIVGHQTRQVREFTYEMDQEAVVVLHSDGVTDRWTLRDYPGLPRRTALTIAATLLRDGGLRRDDACVVVAKAAP
jgi:anti-sigma regulatory factor (Ser/Thr protein kinase)